MAVPQDASINVCFSTTDRPASKLIRWVTRSAASHALITFQSATLGRVMVLEATARGFGLITWSRWRKQGNDLVARFSLVAPPSERQMKALGLLAERLGEAYDAPSLLAFAFRRWIRAKRSVNYLDDPNKLFCSEAVAWYFQLCGLKDFEAPGTFAPGDLLEYAREHPGLFRREE